MRVQIFEGTATSVVRAVNRYLGVLEQRQQAVIAVQVSPVSFVIASGGGEQEIMNHAVIIYEGEAVERSTRAWRYAVDGELEAGKVEKG